MAFTGVVGGSQPCGRPQRSRKSAGKPPKTASKSRENGRQLVLKNCAKIPYFRHQRTLYTDLSAIATPVISGIMMGRQWKFFGGAKICSYTTGWIITFNATKNLIIMLTLQSSVCMGGASRGAGGSCPHALCSAPPQLPPPSQAVIFCSALPSPGLHVCRFQKYWKCNHFSIEISFSNVKKFSSFRGKPLTPIIRDLLALIICCSAPSDCIGDS